MSGQADSTGLSLRADQARPWLVRAAGLSAGAGVIHLMVTPEHIDHWIGYGLFFLVAAAAQLGYSALLALKPSREALLAGVIGNGLILGLYLVTRTVGIPYFGPEAWVVEPVGIVDALSKVIEIALIACLLVLLRLQPASGTTAGQTSA